MSLVKDRIRSALGDIQTNRAAELSKRIREIMDDSPSQYSWPVTKEGIRPDSNESKARFCFNVAVTIIEEEQAAGRLSPGPLRKQNEASTIQPDDSKEGGIKVSESEAKSSTDGVSVASASPGMMLRTRGNDVADIDCVDISIVNTTPPANGSISVFGDSAIRSTESS